MPGESGRFKECVCQHLGIVKPVTEAIGRGGLHGPSSVEVLLRRGEDARDLVKSREKDTAINLLDA